jgi:type IV pilus assembly protein PilC
MLFHYTALDPTGQKHQGDIDALNVDSAIASLQRRGLTIVDVKDAAKSTVLNMNLTIFERVAMKDIVILSRQVSTLFEANVSALRVFQMLGAQTDKPMLKKAISEIASDIQSGSSISKALSLHPKVFSEFYTNMVAAGEESGKLSEAFTFLADYLERSYAVLSKVRGALIYPAFVIAVFIGVMVLLLTQVIPPLTAILIETGQAIPIYTRIVIMVSEGLVSYGIFILVGLILAGFALWRYIKTDEGRLRFDQAKLQIPYIGKLFRMLYLSRIADNLNTMLAAGIPMVRSIEVASNVVNNRVYHDILISTAEQVRGGAAASEALGMFPNEIPNVMTQMLRVGEETGEVGNIMKTLSLFYQREVNNIVDGLVALIEPALIILLGLGVGTVLASVLLPIYNIAGGI